MRENRYHAIGKQFPPKDGVSKVTAQEKYASDITLPNMLHARVLRSPYPHAKVKSIDTSEAEKNGIVCITFDEIPKVKYNERIVSIPKETFKDRTVLTNEPLHVGEAIAAVAAETEEQAQRALEVIKVKYEELEPIFDPIKAMESGGPKLHESIIIEDREVKIEKNIAAEVKIIEGDVEKCFEEADVIIENEYKTGRPYHAQLETKSTVCQPEPDGGITVWTTTQTIHNVRILLGEIFGIPLNKVNVKKTWTGGTFGSSIQMNSIVPICVALALKAKLPVKLVSSREEDMYDHCRYQTIIKFKLGTKKDGTLTAAKMEVIVDIGAHNIQAYPLLGCMAGWLVSLYKVPNVKFEGKAVYTNKVPACAMQGFGNPQINFAVESQMDELAEKLGMDPVELKLKNYVGLGDMFWGQGPTVKSIVKSCGVEEMLKRGAGAIGWDKRPKPGEQRGEIRRGIGMARGFHTSSAGGPLPGGPIDYSGAMVKINEDGTVDLVTALIDVGGGTLDACAKIVAEELGVPLDNVGISPVDTRSTPYDVCTHATRGVYAGGGAVKKVASQVKEKLLEYASRILGAPPRALKIRQDEEIGQGVIYVEGVLEKEVTIGEVAATARYKDWGTIAAVDSLRQVNCPPAYTAHYIEVEVDMGTGKIKPVKAVIGCDAGTVINPELAEGQLHGGLFRGMSYALLEDTKYDEKTGELTNKGFLTDFKILTPPDLPSLENIRIFFTNTYEPTGPFGAKGIGEAALNPVPAAVANAVYNATGTRFREIPITPGKVLEALKEKRVH